jgi:hypothetical protein
LIPPYYYWMRRWNTCRILFLGFNHVNIKHPDQTGRGWTCREKSGLS